MSKISRDDPAIQAQKTCSFCGDFHDFVLPDHLKNELLKGNVVVFAGAGISTEGKLVQPDTFYQIIQDELGFYENIPFPELMTKFCLLPNGRARLLQEIRNRFVNIKSFPHLYTIATRFHQELSTLYLIDSIVSTNWDDFFEQECGATPFVTAEDFVFWSTPGRKVLKIHGSINNLGSIVATSADYDKCYKSLRQGVLGSTLTTMLATKTLLYTGYSFNDQDFIKLHSLLKKEMGNLFPVSYIVTLDCESEERFRKLGLIPIVTNAFYFVSRLKEHATKNGHMIEDERFNGVFDMFLQIRAEHHSFSSKIDFQKEPDAIFSLSYQDGLIQAFARMTNMMKTGVYSHRCFLERSILDYTQWRTEYLKKKRYFDVAYIEGYINGMAFLLADDKVRKFMPRYFIFGIEEQPNTYNKYSRLRRNAFKLHKTAYKQAQRMVENLNGAIPQHMPYFL
jgi:hypothetical protein